MILSNGVLGRVSIGGDNVEGSHNLLSLAMYVSLRCYGSTTVTLTSVLQAIGFEQLLKGVSKLQEGSFCKLCACKVELWLLAK